MGYSEDEIRDHPISEFLHPDDIPKTKVHTAKSSISVPKIDSINRYRCKNGEYRWFSWNTSPLDDRLYTVGRDITDQVRAEQKIRDDLTGSEAQVQQLQKMDAIGRLAGGIAHDFNNMLGAFSLYCDLLADDAENPEAVREKVIDLRNVTARAAALTRQLLVFSRKQVVAPQTISLNTVVGNLEKMLARLIGENIRLNTRLAPDLRGVEIDPSQIEQVVLNLVVNSKDSIIGSGSITIETSNVFLDEEFTKTHLSVSRGQYVQLMVADTGSGMDSETLAKIFEPFFTTKEVGKGTGLGLTTSYGIIKQAHGTIWVYSEINKGTVFKIYLPVSRKNIEDLVAPPKYELNISKGNETILLVEDDEFLREGFSEMLERCGFKVFAAANGQEALEISANFSGEIDLLLSDMVMPGLTGIELAKLIIEKRKNIGVLYMSGYTSDALENSGIKNLNYAEFLQKPFDTHALTAKVREVLGVK